jgi:hypothetical protein
VIKLLSHEVKEEQHMSKRPRRNHAPAFKAKAVLDALKGEQTLVELAERYQIYPNQITEWKRQLLEHAPDILHPHGEGILLSCSDHGLGESDGTGLAPIQHSG